MLGCRGPEAQSPATIVTDFSAVPRESNKVVMPPYVIEPPDILLIDAVRTVPKAPYRLKTADVIAIQVLGTPSDMPITGPRQIEPGGVVRLGPRYGAVNVAHLTLEEAEYAIREYLRQFINDPIVTVSLVEIAGKQQISGQHLVGPDGTVTLGIYGSVRVVGMTLPQAKYGIEQYLSQYLDEPEISIEVWAYNSKVYYVVTQGAGLGDAVYRFPVTGNETVLDAIAQINGLNQLSSKQIWIARPTDGPGKCQILPVEWDAITSLPRRERTSRSCPAIGYSWPRTSSWPSTMGWPSCLRLPSSHGLQYLRRRHRNPFQRSGAERRRQPEVELLTQTDRVAARRLRRRRGLRRRRAPSAA